MKERFHLLSLFAFILSILFSFQNCSGFGPETALDEFNSGSTNSESSSFSSLLPKSECQNILIDEFFKPTGYYQFLQSNCKNCHNGSSDDRPGFASDNKEIAWQKFYLKEIASDYAISKKALSSHQNGITGLQHSQTIELLRSALNFQTAKFNQCQGHLGLKNLGLKTKSISLESVADSGMSITNEDKAFIRIEKATYFEGGTYKEQVFALNPFMRIIYDENSNRWKPITLKKFINPTLTSEESQHTREETYTFINNNKIESKTFTLNPFQRVTLDPTTNFPSLEEYPRSVLFNFNLSDADYTPEDSMDQPPVLMSIELFRSTSVIPMKKKFTIVESATKTVFVDRIIEYKQIIDPFIVVRKPSFKLTSTTLDPVYKFKNLAFLFNDVRIPDATVYRILNATICYNTKTTVMTSNNSQILVFDKVNATDSLSLAFEEVTPLAKANAVCNPDEEIPENLNLPDSITYNQLMGTGDLAIFKNNCLTCHSDSAASGGFDISTYMKAKNSVSRIIERMNDPSSPMPRSGLIDIRSREIVKKWVTLGMPNGM